jgi:hypothetical protein
MRRSLPLDLGRSNPTPGPKTGKGHLPWGYAAKGTSAARVPARLKAARSNDAPHTQAGGDARQAMRLQPPQEAAKRLG